MSLFSRKREQIVEEVEEAVMIIEEISAESEPIPFEERLQSLYGIVGVILAEAAELIEKQSHPFAEDNASIK